MKRRLFSFLLAVVMVFSLASVGFAASDTVVATIGGKNYYTWASAIDDAAEGTIVLQDNVKIEDWTVASDIAIDLNGKTITTTGTITVNSGELALSNGTVIAGSSNIQPALVNVVGGKLTAKNATLSAGEYNVTCVLNNAGTTELEDITVKATTKEFGAVNSTNGSVTVKSGTVTGLVEGTNYVITGGTFTNGLAVHNILSDATYRAQQNTDEVTYQYHVYPQLTKGKDGNLVDAEVEVQACTSETKTIHGVDKDTYGFYCPVCNAKMGGDANVDAVHTWDTTKAVIYKTTDVPKNAKIYNADGTEATDTDLEALKKPVHEEGKTAAAGTGLKYCSVCKAYFVQTIATDCTYETVKVPATCTDDAYTTQKCSVCGEENTKFERIVEKNTKLGYNHDDGTGNSANNWTVVKKATCQEAGLKVRYCAICGDVLETGAIDKTPDVHSLKLVETQTKATCGTTANPGRAAYECTEEGCDYTVVKEIVSVGATKQDDKYHYFASVVVTPATCCKAGVSEMHCVLCGVAQTETDEYGDVVNVTVAVPATNKHSFAYGDSKLVDCTNGTVTGLVCTECGDCYSTLNESVECIPAADHKLEVVSWLYNQEPEGCTDEGEATLRVCSVCGKKNTDVVTVKKAEAHGTTTEVVKPATCVMPAYSVKICDVCGWEDEDTITPVKDSEPVGDLGYHIWDAKFTVVSEANCSADAVVTYTCTVCGDTDKHSYGTWKTTEKTGDDGNPVQDGEWQVDALGEESLIDENVPKYLLNESAHVLGEAKKVVYEAGCTTSGKGDYYCTICYETDVDGNYVTDKNGDLVHKLIKDVVKQAAHYDSAQWVLSEDSVERTCGVDGHKTWLCPICNEVMKEETAETNEALKANGDHTADVTSISYDAEWKCTVYTCRVCGEKFAVDGELMNCYNGKHIGDVVVLKQDPTCTVVGYEQGTLCEKCKTYVKGHEEIPATGHKWDEGTVLTKATCESDGVMKYTCTVCEETKTEVIKATGHGKTKVEGAKAATCTTDGFTGNTVCSVCGKLIKAGEIIPASCASANFTDVAANAWYHDEVDAIVESGLMKGESATTFNPEGEVNRAMVATVLYRQAGSPSVAGLNNPFTDVPAGQWYTDAVIWAASEGVVKGITVTTFAPEASITREQMATMIYRLNGEPKVAEGALKGMADAASISDWAVDAMAWCYTQGIITGVSTTTLVPAGMTTRAQLATILTRL